MICAKPGWGAPEPGQNVYVVTKDGKPVGVCLHYPRAVMEVGVYWDGDRSDVEIYEAPWIEETDVSYEPRDEVVALTEQVMTSRENTAPKPK